VNSGVFIKLAIKKMKRLSLLFSILLIVWITLVSYWYTCQIRNHCGNAAQAPLPETPLPAAEGEEQAASPSMEMKDSLALAQEYLKGVGTKKYYFDFASTELKTAGDDEMYFKSLGYLLTNRPGTSVMIVGHACSRGSDEANERFSRLRAEKVKQHLVDKGIPGEKITLDWKGDREPAASNETEDGRKLNRRAEISINQ
jgi:outer membrane protein OmpA-like peptidoglycan-associated protein